MQTNFYASGTSIKSNTRQIGPLFPNGLIQWLKTPEESERALNTAISVTIHYILSDKAELVSIGAERREILFFYLDQ